MHLTLSQSACVPGCVYLAVCTWLCVAMCVSSVIRNSDGDEALLREVVPQDISWIRETLERREGWPRYTNCVGM